MNNRNIEIKVRLNRKEAEALNKKVKKSRISREAICATSSTGSSHRTRPRPNILTLCANCTWSEIT
ncbi:MAG: hypothetical protein ACLRXC_11905 [[Clostridium] leptum]